MDSVMKKAFRSVFVLLGVSPQPAQEASPAMTIRITAAAMIVALCGLLAVTTAPAHGGVAPTCFGQAATIVGTPAADTIIGTPGPDVIVGQAGADIIRGRGGNDRICGGVGADIIKGGFGNDMLSGGGGADIIHGNQGHDTIRGGPGTDVCTSPRNAPGCES